MFPMLPPPPSANPFSPPSDPRSPTPPPAPPSGKRKRVTVDVEAIEEEKQRLYYTKDEDVRLVSAWLNNSVNPIEGNAKKREYYWKEVADAYNSTTESDRKRDIKNLKNHWYKTTPKVTSFNGCYNQISDTYASGCCDKQLLQQALDLYHSRHGHQFMYVHWWEAVRDSQKWKIHVYTEGDGTKRSPAAPTEKTPRPTGCKAAKKARGKDKEAPAEINGMKEQIGAFLQAQAETKVQTEEMMELQSRLSAQKLEANRLAYESAKERTIAKLAEERTKLFDKFTEMLNADTSRMEPWAKEMHMRAVTRLGDQLFKEE